MERQSLSPRDRDPYSAAQDGALMPITSSTARMNAAGCSLDMLCPTPETHVVPPGWRQRIGRDWARGDYVSRKGSSAASLTVCSRKFESATPTSRTPFGGGNTGPPHVVGRLPRFGVDGRSRRISLKNPDIGPPRESRFRPRRVISTESPHCRAHRSVARSKTGRSAETLRNFSPRLPAGF
jgi:hypothetical protein